MTGDPDWPIAEPKTFQPRDKSIYFGLHPSRKQDIIFAFSLPTHFSNSAKFI
jgi:hypothetical protein